MSGEKIANHHEWGKPYFDDPSGQEIPLGNVVTLYNIKVENMMLGGQGNQFTKNITEKSDPPKRWYKTTWFAFLAAVGFLGGLVGILTFFFGIENWGKLLEQLKAFF